VVKAFGLFLVALVIMLVLFIPLVLLQCCRHIIIQRPLPDVFWNAAIGLDQLGGAILYGEPDWTVSSRTYWLRSEGNRFAGAFERVIDLFFGKGHCEESYQNEFKQGRLS